jgi:hypothetical protein
VPIFIECHRCTACCRWLGEVRLSAEEIAQLAAFQNLAETDFIEKFTRLRKDRRGLALLEKANGECIFLAGENCAVQAVKPQQCRDFPNRWVNSLWGKVPLGDIKENYPMLANCSAFKAFVKTEEKTTAPAPKPAA